MGLLILAAGNVAFTARGRAHVIEESMEAAPGFAAVALEVEAIDDHRMPSELVDSGVHDRVTALGGRLDIDSPPDAGTAVTAVTATLPVQRAATK